MSQIDQYPFEMEIRKELHDTNEKLNQHILDYSVGQARLSQDLAYIKTEIKSMKDMDREFVMVQKEQTIQLSKINESKKGWKWIVDKLLNLIFYLIGASLVWLAAQAIS